MPICLAEGILASIYRECNEHGQALCFQERPES